MPVSGGNRLTFATSVILRVMIDRYADHRRRLGEMVGLDGLAVIPAATEEIRNHDVMHQFRQESAFWYLTGFHEPDAVAIITPGHAEGDYTLLVRPKDPALEVWTGIRTGTHKAEEAFGADSAYEIGELDTVLERLMIGREVLWYTTGNPAFDSKVTDIINSARSHRERMGGVVPSTVKDVSVPLGEMMLIKDAVDADSLRQACHLTAEGHREAMRYAQPGMPEYEVQAVLEYFWRLKGSRRNGYPSIVASGANACVLHYEENDTVVGDSDLILIDAAAEVDGYSSDITRTFPANGKFTDPQRAIYNIVLAAEKRGVEMSVPGSSMRAVHDEATRILTAGMVEIGLLPGSVDDALAMHHYQHFFMHGTGHWLGLDVHDLGSYRVDGAPRPLQAGMSFTVEPGIYVAPGKAEIELTMLSHDTDEWNERRIRLGRTVAAAKEAEEKEAAEKVTHVVPQEFLGIGVRIEDDILATAKGNENMTESVPIEIDEVEALCAEESSLPRG